MKSGNSFSPATHALIRKASIVTRTSCFLYSSFSVFRSASRSVMSASSLWVTCGMRTQLRARFAPEIFRIRDSGTTSTSPYLEKSIDGHGSSSRPLSPPEGAAAGAGGPSLNARTSSPVIRPLRPEPVTCARSTPSSRASRRVPGLA